MGFISYWSNQSELPIDSPRVDAILQGAQHPLAHAWAFGILGVLAWWAMRPHPRAVLGAWLVAAVFGALDEWHQSFTPGRAVEFADWLVDASAGAAFVLVAEAVRRWRPSLPHFALSSRSTRGLAASAVALACVLLVGVAQAPPGSAKGIASRGAAAVSRALPHSVESAAGAAARRAYRFARLARDEVKAVLFA